MAAPRKHEFALPNYTTPVAKKTRACSNQKLVALKRASSYGFADSPFVMPPSPMMKKLGCGTQVTIYRYQRKTGTGVLASPWAVKKAKCGRTKIPVVSRLKKEGEILRQLDHPNIVKFKKLTSTDIGEVCLSMEEFGKGLDDIINHQQISGYLFSHRKVMSVMWSIANALEYLHNSIKLLHGDIKSGNVLVRGNFEEIKLCDFGVSIFLKDDLSGPKNDSDTYVGSEPWLSKEVLEQNEQKIITDKADIFAYGLVIWEMLALDVPHVGLMYQEEEELLDGSFSEAGNDTMESISDAYFDALGTRPPLPNVDYSSKYDTVLEVFVCCTMEDYTYRPKAEEIVKTLSEYAIHEGKRKDIQIDESEQDTKPDSKRGRLDEIFPETDNETAEHETFGKVNQYNKENELVMKSVSNDNV